MNTTNVCFCKCYCRVQYKTANNNKNNYSAPASRTSLVWDRPKNLFNITSYIGPGQAAGVKSSCIPDPTLAHIN